MDSRSIKKVMSIVAIAALAFLLPAASASALTLNLGGGTVVAGNSVSLNGTCTVVPGGSNDVLITVTSNGTTTSLGTLQTNASGQFQGNFSIPGNLSGASTVTATCVSDNGFVNAPLQITGLDVGGNNDGNNNVLATVTLGDTTLNAGNSVAVSGVCTPGQTVNFTLNQNGVVTNLGSTTASANGNFSTTLTIPSGAANGSAVLTASCGGNMAANANLTISAAANNTNVTAGPGASLVFSDTTLTPGQLVMASGVCGTASVGGTVRFALVQNGQSQPIEGIATAVTSRGAFDAEIRIPATVVNGEATIVAICPNTGSTVNGGVVLTGAVARPAGTGTTTTNNGGTTAVNQGTVNIMGGVTEGMGGGTDTGYVMPLGGVDTGAGAEKGMSAGYLALGVLALGSAAAMRRKLAIR